MTTSNTNNTNESHAMKHYPNTKLNELVETLEGKGYVNKNSKALPYLGWIWRDISRSRTDIAWSNGQLWIDEAAKWGFPKTEISNKTPPEDEYDVIPDQRQYISDALDDMCADIVEVLEDILDEERFTNEHSYRFQEILFEYSGHIAVEWYRCNECGEEFSTLLDPIDEHNEQTLNQHFAEEHDESYHDEKTVAHHYIDTDPYSDSRGSKLDPKEVEDTTDT